MLIFVHKYLVFVGGFQINWLNIRSRFATAGKPVKKEIVGVMNGITGFYLLHIFAYSFTN